MISVDVPKNLDEIQTKAIGNFTKRQVIFYGIGGAFGVALFFLTKGPFGMQIASILAMFCAMPAFILSSYEKNGFTGEQILLLIFYKKFLTKEVRPYQSENIYYDLMIDEEYRKEKAEIERKLYGYSKEELAIKKREEKERRRNAKKRANSRES